MSSPEAKILKRTLVDAGFEVYRTQPDEIYLAERVRYHIMDSGVRVVLGTPRKIRFTSRCQRSDFPNESPDTMFALVRSKVGALAIERGYAEIASETVEMKSPSDDAHIVDVWFEVVFEKTLPDVDHIDPSGPFFDELRWALAADKYVQLT